MPIVVTTMSRTAVSWSTRKPMSTEKLPAGIQCHNVTATADPSPPPSTCATTSIAASQDRTTAPTGAQNASSPRRRPMVAVTMKPASGSAMIRMTSSWSKLTWRTSPASSAHRVVLVDEWRLPVAEDGDDDRQADGRLRGGHGHDQQRDDRAVALQIRDERTERDDGQVDAIEHELDRHEHRDRVPAGEEAERADREQRTGQREVRVQLLGDAHQGTSFSRLARKTPPMTAARRSTLTASKAST